jgi:RNA polymerase sigma-70 factor (ECF subfamily)
VTPQLTDDRRRWLSELYEANSAAVFNLCRRRLTSREDAADATHEVFLRAAASLSEAPDTPQARAWLITVARNHCIDVLRRRERFGSALVTLASTADAGSDSVRAVEDRQLLLAVLRQLDVRDRQALWESAVERRPLAEIASSFGLSYAAAAQVLHRARRRASVVATRLAVILGLAQLGRAARRSNLVLRGQQVAAVVVVPLVIAAVVVSSSPRAPIGANASAQAATSLSLGPSIGHRSRGGSGVLPGTGSVGTDAVATVPAVQTVAVRPVPTPPGVGANPAHPRHSRIEVDHGKGRDRDRR